MWQKRCRLTIADKYHGGVGGGGGGSTDIQEITPGTIKPFQQFYYNQLDKYGNREPLEKALQAGALKFFGQLPGYLTQAEQLLPNLQNAYGYYGDIIRNRGDIGPTTNPELFRNIQQQTNIAASQAGAGRQVSNIVNRALNTQQAREQRLQGAVQGEQGLAGSILGGLSGIQGLQTGGLNQVIGAQASKVGTFVPLAQLAQNPVLANLQAWIAKAQIAAQQKIAAAGNKSSTTGGIASGLGSIIGGIAMSDERLKTDIKPTRLKTVEGLPVKTFEYRFNPGKRFAGVLAQDVEEKLPERVITEPRSGIKMVIGFPMIEVSPIGKRKVA